MICLDNVEPTKMLPSYGPTQKIEEDAQEEAIRIDDPESPEGFKYLVELESSILKQLGQKTLLFLYVFANNFILRKFGRDRETIEKKLKNSIDLNLLPF
jgi:hypothetical protein